jgi:WD40 repeat protein
LLRGHSGSVWDVVFTRDGRQVISVGADRTVKFWPGTPHGMPRGLDRTDQRIRRSELSADGRVLVVLRDDGALEVWSTEADRRLCRLAGSYDVRGTRFALSGDGNYLALRADWQTVTVTRTVDGAVVQAIRSPSLDETMPALSLDGGEVALGQKDRCITVWDVRQARCLERLSLPEGKLEKLVFSPGSDVLAAAIRRDRASHIFLWQRGSERGPVKIANGSRLAFSPEGDLLAVFGDTGVVSLWNPATGRREAKLDGMSGRVCAVGFAGPARLLTGDDRGTVTIWDTLTRREILSLRDVSWPVEYLAVTDGRTARAASADGSLRRWEVGSVNMNSGGRDGLLSTLAQERQR